MADSEGDGLLVRLPHTMNPITRPLWFDRIFLKTLDLWPFEPHAKAFREERKENNTNQISGPEADGWIVFKAGSA